MLQDNSFTLNMVVRNGMQEIRFGSEPVSVQLLIVVVTVRCDKMFT